MVVDNEVSETVEPLVEQLTRLGFTLYEAKAYVGLQVHGEQTGYGLANLTGVPQPKVYETLRRLAENGSIYQTSDKPAVYSAVPAEELLTRLEAEYKQHLKAARADLERLRVRPSEERREWVWKQSGLEPVVARARSAIAGATATVYLSGGATALKPLQGTVADAAERGVRFVVLHLGRLPFPVPQGQVFRHASTDGTLFPRHQARHLAVVADSTSALWALARDGKHWQGLYSENETFVSAIKGYIRHDIMVQRIYADMPKELTARYGPGLLELARISSPGTADKPDEDAQDLFFVR